MFLGLAVGTYNVIVKDESEICMYNESVSVKVKSQVVINEINYNSSDAFNPSDWIELYNSQPTSIDLSNWQIKDDNDNHVFVIPEGTQIEGNNYLVIVKNEMNFVSVFPNIPYVGELSFGFGQTDAVRLFNPWDKLMDEVYYTSEQPWPSCANGTGNTLELISPDLDNSLPESWNCINTYGSPKAINDTSNSGEASGVIIYPNPVQNILYVKGNSEAYSIEIYSLIGQLVKTVSNANEIDVSLLSQGIYLIRIRNENISTTQRFIKF